MSHQHLPSTELSVRSRACTLLRILHAHDTHEHWMLAAVKQRSGGGDAGTGSKPPARTGGATTTTTGSGGGGWRVGGPSKYAKALDSELLRFAPRALALAQAMPHLFTVRACPCSACSNPCALYCAGCPPLA